MNLGITPNFSTMNQTNQRSNARPAFGMNLDMAPEVTTLLRNELDKTQCPLDFVLEIAKKLKLGNGTEPRVNVVLNPDNKEFPIKLTLKECDGLDLSKVGKDVEKDTKPSHLYFHLARIRTSLDFHLRKEAEEARKDKKMSTLLNKFA